MRILSNTIYILLTGYTLIFFSEWMFWAGRPPVDGIVGEAILTLLLYSFVGILFLAAVDYFHVRSFWAVFLAGALYGFMIEGIIVPTMYADFPLNLSWTPLAWHAILTILFGWYYLPNALRQSPKAGILASLGFGVFTGLWSLGWWSETLLAPPGTMVIYYCAFSLLFFIALVLRGRFPRPDFSQPGRGIYIAIGLMVLYFVVVTLPQQPFALVILPPLLVILLLTLRKNRQTELLNPSPSRSMVLTARQALPVLLIPVMASLIYVLFYNANPPALPVLPIPAVATPVYALFYNMTLPTLPLAYLVLTPAGFILFGISIYRIWKPKPV